MTFEEIYAVDSSNMHGLLRNTPAQVREAVAIGKAASLRLNTRGVENIVVCGLGGSAIGGDLLRSYLAGELAVPLTVNRAYTLPRFVGRNTLVIISSYSGNTEETIAAHSEARKRRAKLLCISSGGATTTTARAHRTPLITIPGGLPPRAALGYSFFPLLIALSRLGFVGNKLRDISETIALMEQKAETYGIPDPATNRALQLASLLQHRIGVIYSSTERFDAVSTRWRGQIAENAKSLCFGHVLPEMNHNELVGWRTLTAQMREMQVLFLRDRQDHPRIAARAEITREVVGRYTPNVADVWSEGRSLLTRMFSLVTLGDWVSYYLAILHRQDPTPVEVIDELKGRLAAIKD
jgi:glucose/mannose-6-phosphate isomerase